MYTSNLGLLAPRTSYPNEPKPTCLDIPSNLLGILRIDDTNVLWHMQIT